MVIFQKREIAVDVVTGEPASAAVQFAIPPATRITIEDSDDLTSLESETSGISLLGNVVMHSKDELRLRPLREAQIC